MNEMPLTLEELRIVRALPDHLRDVADMLPRLVLEITRAREATVRREKESAAWARLVKATAEERDAAAASLADRERGCRPVPWAREQNELEAAKQALRDLGVDVDALLSD